MDYERYSYSNNQYPNDYKGQPSGTDYSYSRSDYTTAEEGNGYRSVNTNRVDRSYIPNEPVRKPKKSGGAGSVIKKLALGIAVGAFFGISAGVAFYFVNLATGVMDMTKTEESINATVTRAAKIGLTIQVTTLNIVKTICQNISDFFVSARAYQAPIFLNILHFSQQ